MRGLLVVFEGSEGAGKSTQLRRLGQWLEQAGHSVVSVREPGGTPLGDDIRRVLLDPASEIVPAAEALLFMASRAQVVDAVIRPAVERGAIVLVDRFFLSTYAYQADARGLPLSDVRQANRLAVGELVPDLTILLQVPVGDGLVRAAQRSGPDRMEQTGDAFHDRVASAFARFATVEWQQAHPECGPIMPVDGTGDEAAVEQRIRAVLANRWPETFPLGSVSEGQTSPVPHPAAWDVG